VLRVADDADNADSRRRINWPRRRLVVETDIATRDRNIKRAAALSQSIDGLLQHVEILRVVRIAKVKIVRQRQRFRAGHGEISRTFRHRDKRTEFRFQRDVVGVAIDRGREIFPRILSVGIRTTAASLPGAVTVPTRTM